MPATVLASNGNENRRQSRPETFNRNACDAIFFPDAQVDAKKSFNFQPYLFGNCQLVSEFLHL